MSGVREVLILSCFGMGHYNPNMQLARACLSQLPEGSHITMLVPLPQYSARCVARPEEDGGDFTLLKNDWTLRFLDGGRIHQWFWLYCSEAEAGQQSEASENEKILKWFFENQLSWVDHVKRIYANRCTKPDVIFADIAVFFDGPIAEYYRIPSYYFFPSPLFFYNILHHIHKFAIDVEKKIAQSTPVEELDIDHPIIELPGLQGLTVDLVSEALVQDLANAAITVYFSEITFMANSKRAGVVCNDVGELYGPEAVEAARAGTDFKVFTVGPLAIHFDERVLPKPDTSCYPHRSGRNDRDSVDPNLAWLDKQRPGSIVFISFGSSFDLGHRDLFELAGAIGSLVDEPRPDGPAGFIWAHRPTKQRDEALDADEVGLPSGWREKYADRVRVCPWVNQMALLKHEAVGLFVTHSGWNGLTEAISVGHAPLLMLPVGAEQPGNAKVMESFHQVGERLRPHPTLGGPLDRTRVSQQICKCLNNEYYAANVGKLKKVCESAWAPDGSSRRALKKLLS